MLATIVGLVIVGVVWCISVLVLKSTDRAEQSKNRGKVLTEEENALLVVRKVAYVVWAICLVTLALAATAVLLGVLAGGLFPLVEFGFNLFG